MKPLYIFRHIACDKSGFLCHYLLQRNIPFELICVAPDVPLDCDLSAASGLIFLGAAHSVNNPQSWINDEIKLIQRAASINLPVMGVCFGGQLLTRALGGEVQKDEQMQVGWHPVNLTKEGKSLLAGTSLPDSFHAFEWHAESFSLPPGATPLFCDGDNHNQGYLHGNFLAMQFHLEMTGELIETSLSHFADCLPPACGSVQSNEQILLDSPRYLADMHRAAESIYGWWLEQYVKK